MMKLKFRLILLSVWIAFPGMAQQGNWQENMKKQYAHALKQEAEAAKTYYAGADTAAYGIRYLWSYLYDKEKRLTYREDRVVWVTPDATLDMSFQSIGEKRWMKRNVTNKWSTRDSSLAYRLTPSFYFYYPKEKRLKRTYRIISDEFLLTDTLVGNQWTVTGEEKNIGGYACRKAVCTNGGRRWIAWYTSALPYQAAPRQLVGLPGVVLEACDEAGEICWKFNGYLPGGGENRAYVKYPDRFSDIPVEKFPLLLKLFARSGSNYVETSKVLAKHPGVLPEKLKPSTGIDACIITNPIRIGQ